jgi:hypothetical protein
VDALFATIRIERAWTPHAIHRAARFLEGACGIYLAGSASESAGSGG